eukprot:GHVU01198972.1.p1 GENE.GHVU01198972.1~~GHVU01198972.1.p1  ORF type:complete len:437 (-),score=61.52 GHVU01198972.1:529-1839(-)
MVAKIWKYWKIDMPSEHKFPFMPSYEQLLDDAERIHPALTRLREHLFFRIFRADLTKKCPFSVSKAMCSSNGSCDVCECTKDEVPLRYRERPVENVIDDSADSRETTPWEDPMTNGSSFNIEIDSRTASTKYVDLRVNKPIYTAYKGGHVWRQLYRENCMGYNGTEAKSEAGLVDSAAESVRSEEGRNFYRLVSGMQTNIAMQSAEYFYRKPLKQYTAIARAGSSPDYAPNIVHFMDHVGKHHNRIENLYFTFSALVRTMCAVTPVLRRCTCDTGHEVEDQEAKRHLDVLTALQLHACQPEHIAYPLFDKRQEEAVEQFRNVSRILDCVECQKCRLHGKLQTTALGIVFRATGPSQPAVTMLERNEIVALIGALAYFADSIVIMKAMALRVDMYVHHQIFRWITPVVVVALFLGAVGIYRHEMNSPRAAVPKPKAS